MIEGQPSVNKMRRIYYTKPSITEREVAYATDAARTGWGELCYEYIGRFEKLFSDFTDARYAIATSSCTGALHMGMAAVGITSGDEVILADTNWIASAAPITYLGATPVFVDILEDTWCIDPDRVEAAITPRTKAILAVHLYGNLCEMDRLLELGERHSIAVIEDAAEAIGSKWTDKHAGTMGAFGTFSFHGTKTITTGEGGMFITNDEALYKKTLALSNHGRVAGQAKQFWPDYIGFKYKMSNIQAAIGCAQMERIDALVKRKRDIFDYYHARLKMIPGIAMNPERQSTVNGYWMPTLVFAPETGVTRERLTQAFGAANIDGRIFFHELSSLPMFAPRLENRNSYSIPSRAINLPSYHDMTEDDLERVVQVVLTVLAQTKPQ
jgi:perosamine synthetase